LPVPMPTSLMRFLHGSWRPEGESWFGRWGRRGLQAYLHRTSGLPAAGVIKRLTQVLRPVSEGRSLRLAPLELRV
jgi:hypothetical protein